VLTSILAIDGGGVYIPKKIITKGSMPVETGSRSLYRDICSEDDPPRSVAICPQRRCVAFGCSTGIELHWVDALTGQDLNRWFPLTAPSDYLFFLPPRKSVDSAKKLRLISSAGRPTERSVISRRGVAEARKPTLYWGGSEVVAKLKGQAGHMDLSDHYRAVPLSDGYHILFTDPLTELLCLGSDAPAGGPTKLLRRIWFQGPKGKGSPVAYAGGADLNHGVRVVAAYDIGNKKQTIWLYSVPRDIFAASQASLSVVGSSWLNSGSRQEMKRNVEWMAWLPDGGLQEWLNHAGEPVGGVLPKSVWPVRIQGQEIAVCDAIIDLAIDSSPAMTIWAFCRDGIAKVWKLDDRNQASESTTFAVGFTNLKHATDV
jgi:hypothetical protein